MCGFVVVQQKQHPAIQADIQHALTEISHRGPDHASVWLSRDGKTGLGHTRLSIIDLDSGNQPIVNEVHQIAIVVNGEFYDYKKIRQGLEAKGYVFQTQTDSEILIYLYLEYGLDLFEHLRGEFSFALYDAAKDQLLVGRDRFGIKPLCFYHDSEKLLVASKAKALFALGVEGVWDEYSFMHAASLQYQPTDRTFFKNIHQLSPGHFMVYKNHTLNIQQYWDLDYPLDDAPSAQKADHEYIEEFRETLSQAIRLRLVSDVPVCFHLSGGLDSSAVVGLSGQELATKKHCFTVAFEEQEAYNELALAQKTAEFTNSQLHVVNVSREDLLHHLSDAVYFSEGLAINGHLTGKFLLNRAIQKAGFKVALTGEGADEVLAGYPHLRQDLLNRTPSADGEAIIKKLFETNPVSIGVQLAQGNELALEAIENRLGFVPSFLRAKASFGLKVQSVISNPVIEKYHAFDFYHDMINTYDWQNQLRGRHPVDQSLYLWNKLTLANYILNTLGDGCEMASSIEGRLPFLDHKLFEFTRTLPMDLKIRDGKEKYILKEAVKPYITDQIYKRQKHPFMAPPLSQGLQNADMDFIMDHLRGTAFNHLAYFDQKKVTHLLRKLPQMAPVELTAHEPVIMFMLTALFLQERFKLS